MLSQQYTKYCEVHVNVDNRKCAIIYTYSECNISSVTIPEIQCLSMIQHTVTLKEYQLWLSERFLFVRENCSLLCPPLQPLEIVVASNSSITGETDRNNDKLSGATVLVTSIY